MYRIAFVFFLLLFFSCSKKNEVLTPEFKVELIKDIISRSQYADTTKQHKLQLADSAKSLINTLQKDTLYNELAIEVASCYYMIREWDLYTKATDVFLENAKRINDSAAIAKGYYNYGLIKNRILQYDSAYYYYYKAFKEYQKLGNNKRIGRSALGMALIQRKKGDLIGAEASYIVSLDAFKKIEASEYIGDCINGLGILRRAMRDYDQAILYHEEYLELKSGLDDELEKALPFNNLGWDYENKGDLIKAKSYYEKGLALYELKQKKTSTYGILIDNYAHVRFLQGEVGHLPAPYFEALAIADNLNNLNLAISANLNLSEYYGHVGDISNAKKYATNAYEIGRDNIYLEKVPKALKQLQSLTVGNEALRYANLYIKLTDSLQQEERRSRDQFARIRFESDELEAEKESLQMENEKNETRIQWLTIVTLGVLLIGLLLFIIKRQQDSKRKLLVAQRQQKANEEIYQLMLTQQTKLNEGRSMERKRFSKELHDGVLSRLFGVRLSLESMNLNGQNSTKELYVNELQGIEKEIRQISHDLGSDIFEGKQDFVNVVDDLLIRQSSIAAWKYELIDDDLINWGVVSSPFKMHMYRIIQEALQNINKYADARLVHIIFDNKENGITITIKDDGKGFNLKETSRRKGIGLQNMRSRAKEINAKIEIESEINKGTSITLSGIKIETSALANGNE
ncbi:ATP-binding protein [Spongiivirga citrea]|uniref:histidine kinase n=1 Tax=Spongiivirga citrea TaxID=1481457 RepID=A0A6M0CIV1_9FLAO|nr:tetratricopeptide repeat-containing sensor histidine kinase [Spongiivirga citrea]NER16903.1 tetratricopeptide repeat protein [Spongiivirga citrea]